MLFTFLSMVLLFTGCLNDESDDAKTENGASTMSTDPVGQDMTVETDNETSPVEEPSWGMILENGYLLELRLTQEEPYYYEVNISGDDGESWQTGKARIFSRPVPYYADEDYFILRVREEPEDFDSFGNHGNRSFLLYEKNKKRFRRLVTRDYDIQSFRVFDGKLYCGVHQDEGPYGSISIIDITTGEVQYITDIDEGGDLSTIEAWAPQVQPIADGELRVWLNEYDRQSYTIEGDVLNPSEILFSQPFYCNPEIPLR
jgi:hypothetical protein